VKYLKELEIWFIWRSWLCHKMVYVEEFQVVMLKNINIRVGKYKKILENSVVEMGVKWVANVGLLVL